ncbi:hypothetical protein [Pseudoalteromonas sp. T1lg22]|uniref:hypothetical protein n=1 Tax=Pseudoalteromonas sp. T1lg22 TaxID=2077096 RepID=UPI000CF666A9|nr:hypothetical protein [Pseudoalteromonas sp. T1lg22]
MKRIVLFLLILNSQLANAETRAVTDIKAYNFPPPASSVHKVIYQYKKGESLKLKYGACVSSHCQVITPSGEVAWILEFQTTSNSDLEQAHQDYLKAGFEQWDEIYISVWYSVKDNKNKLDSCALKLAHEVKFDSSRDWPAFCNTFKNTNQVQERVEFIENTIANLHLTPNELEKVKSGKVWIGASDKAVLVSWGSPEDINSTITSHGRREQWVYGRGTYVYLTNGFVSAIQN